MAQAAMALAGSADAPVFENVEFLRPVAVSDTGATDHPAGRVAARKRLRSKFACAPRKRIFKWTISARSAGLRRADETSWLPRLSLSPFESEHLPLDPQNDLYGRILFHRGRFCRLRGYRLLKARECVAEITADDGAAWFGPYLPAEFVLGNPAARDAALHAIQACIPHRRILPTGIERMVIRRHESGARFVRAKERLRDGDNFVYDVEVTDARGEVIERWDGLAFARGGSDGRARGVAGRAAGAVSRTAAGGIGGRGRAGESRARTRFARGTSGGHATR